MTEHTLDEVRTISKDRYSNINRIWQLRMEQVAFLSNNSVLNEFIIAHDKQKEIDAAESVARLEKELRLFKESTGDPHGFSEFVILDKNDNIIYKNSDRIDPISYPKNKKPGFVVIEDPSSPSTALLIVAMPIYGETHQIVGSVLTGRNIMIAQQILQDRSYLGQSGESYLVSSDKKMITESRFIPDAQFNQIVDTKPVRECFERNRSVDGEWPDYRGIPVFGSSMCDKENGLVLIAEQDVAEALSSLDLLKINAIAILLLISGLLALSSIVLSRKISEPLKKLVDATTKIKEGNYDIKINITNKDELGILGNRFDYLCKEISYANVLKHLVDEKTSHLETVNDDLQKSLLENLNMRQALDESSIVAITDVHGNITHANQKFCEISKYSKEDLIGQNHRLLKSGFHSPEFYQKIWETISNGNVWRGVIKNKAKDGTFYWVQTTIVPFVNENGLITQYISIRSDVTDQMILQEEKLMRERFTAIGELASRLAHDIRNPLSVLQTSLEVMKKKQSLGERSDESSFERMGRAISRISHQVNEVLDFIRKNPIKIDQISSNDLIEMALEKITISKSIIVRKPDANVEIECDVLKIDALLTNLILNAVQAIGENGTISIRISDDSENIIIKIEDSGPGIPENILPKIFDPLFTTKQTGTGLGLSSCKSIVEAHHGTISVKNNPTTFTVTLPKYFISK